MEKSFERSLASLPLIFDFLREFEVRHRLSPNDAGNLELIVDELFTNCVEHAGGSAPVRIDLEFVENGLVALTVTDPDSEHFDVTRAKKSDTFLPLDLVTIGGLGLHLVKHTAEHVDYEYRDRVSKTRVHIKLRGKPS